MQPEQTRLGPPGALRRVVEAQGPIADPQGDVRRLSGLEDDPLKSLELPGRPRERALEVFDIELDYLGPATRSGVAHGRGDSHLFALAQPGGGKTQVRHLEGCVAEPVAKGELGLQAPGVEVAIADKDPLGVAHVAVLLRQALEPRRRPVIDELPQPGAQGQPLARPLGVARVVGHRRVIGPALCHGKGQLARRVVRTHESLRDGAAGDLAQVHRVQDRGRAAGEWVKQALGGKGKVVELKGLMTSTPGQDRHQGFREGIAGGGIEVVFEADMKWLEPEARKEMESALARFDAIDLVYAHNDPGAHGAYLAAKAAGREGAIRFVGIDALPQEGVAYVAQGILAATFEYPTGGREAIAAALKILAGQPVEKKIVLGSRLFTKDTAASGGTPDSVTPGGEGRTP